jgi:hypothetical protein
LLSAFAGRPGQAALALPTRLPCGAGRPDRPRLSTFAPRPLRTRLAARAGRARRPYRAQLAILAVTHCEDGAVDGAEPLGNAGAQLGEGRAILRDDKLAVAVPLPLGFAEGLAQYLSPSVA